MVASLFALCALVLASALVVVFYHYNDSQSITLEQELRSRIQQSPDAEFEAEYKRSQKLQAIDSTEGAENVNARFGGGFKNGVGSNTWKGTPWSKYDEANAPRHQMLSEDSRKEIMPDSAESPLSAMTGDEPPLSAMRDEETETPQAPVSDETSIKGADDPSEIVSHATEEGVGIEGSNKLAGADPHAEAESDIDPKTKAAQLKLVIKSCVKACTMPLCVKACKAIGDPKKLDELVKEPVKPRLQQQAAVMQPPDSDWRSFVKKCEDTCKIEACKQMCRAAGSKEREVKPVEFHYDPATTDEATGLRRDAEDVTGAPSGSANLSPILPPPLPPGVHRPDDDTMSARHMQRRPQIRVIEKAPTMELAEKGDGKAAPWFDAETFNGKARDESASVPQKMFFWEGLGDEKDRRTSKDRSERPIGGDGHKARGPAAGGAGAHGRKHPAAGLAAPTEMLLQENADPYYVGGDGSQDREVGNPYEKGWGKVKGTNLDQVNAAIDQQLEPLAQEYPYIRAIRH